MRRDDYIPRKNVDFITWVTNFLKYLYSSISRFNFPPDEYQKLVMRRDDLVQKFEAAENPSTRTPLAIQARNSARKTLEKMLRSVVKEFLTFNRAVTDEDRIGLGLRIYKSTRTPSSVADESPDIDVDTSTPGRVGIHFFEKSSRHKKAKPAGQAAVEVAWIISDTLPTRWDQLLHSDINTNSPYILSFENDRRGKTVYFALRWVNTRGEKGPWTKIESAIIP
jgi:hypothetical protein